MLTLCLLPAAHAGSAEAIFSEGLQAYTAEDYERALKLFEEAVGIEPNESRYHHWVGKAAGRRAERVNPFRAAGLARKVRTSFERAVELAPTSIAALTDLFEYYLEAPAILGGGEDKARAAAERLAKLNPAAGHRAQADLAAKRKDYAAAEQEFRRVLELEPDKPSHYLDLAVFLTRRGRYDEGASLLDRAAAMAAGSPQVLFTRGKCLVIANKDPETARQLLEQYLQFPRQPDDPSPSEVRELLKKLPSQRQAAGHSPAEASRAAQSSVTKSPNRQIVNVP